MKVKNTEEMEQHRKECEARQVLKWPFAKRKPYLELVGKRRGEKARMELETEIIRQQHRMAKAAA